MEKFEKEVKVIEAEHNINLKEYNDVKAKIEKSAAEFKEFERLDVKFTEDIAFHEQKLKKLKQTEERENEQVKALLAEAEQLKTNAPTREKELESAERHKASLVAKLEKLYEGLKGKAEELRPLKEEKEAELVPIQKKLTEVRKVVEVAQTEATLLREKTTKIADEIDVVKKEHSDCSQRLQDREKESKETEKLKQERLNLTKEAKQRLTTVNKEIESLTTEVANTRVKAEEARSSFEQEHHRGRLIRAVYDMSKAGKLKGIHGRLGDLGTSGQKIRRGCVYRLRHA
jgi:structural maintenance of chromosome 4